MVELRYARSKHLESVEYADPTMTYSSFHREGALTECVTDDASCCHDEACVVPLGKCAATGEAGRLINGDCPKCVWLLIVGVVEPSCCPPVTVEVCGSDHHATEVPD